MRATNEDLLAATLARAYAYCDVATLRRGFEGVQQNGKDLPQALLDAELLSEFRAEKLRRGVSLSLRLLGDAIYGMVTMRNQLLNRRSKVAASSVDLGFEKKVTLSVRNSMVIWTN